MLNLIAHTIQNTCKVAIFIFFAGWALNCGTQSPVVETVRFQDSTVSFSNSSCVVSFTMNNSSSNSYSLASIIGTFEDENGNTEEIVVPQGELIQDLQPPVIPALGVSNANVTFHLSNSTLTPPLRGTVIVVGVSGSQVAHFVGNFDCE